MDSKQKIQKPFLRYKRFGNQYLITSEIGTWRFLSKTEFQILTKFPKNSMPKSLYKQLRHRGLLVYKNNLKDHLERYRLRYENLYKGPSLFIIGLTKQCNLRCIYCQQTANGAEKEKIQKEDMIFSVAIIEKIIQFILKSTSKKNIMIEFQGGEPLLFFDTIKIFVEKTKKANREYNKNIAFSLTTNLTLLDNEKISYFIQEKIGICGSLDGPEIIHDKQRVFRNKKGSYNRIKNNLKKLSKTTHKLNLISVITKNSIGHSKKFIDELIALGVKIFSINWVNRNGRAINPLNWEKINISAQEYFQFWTEVMEYIRELNSQGHDKLKERFMELILSKLFTTTEVNHVDWTSPCGAFIGQIAFDAKGNVYSCDEARNDSSLILGNVFEDDYKSILNKKLTQTIIKESLLENHICDYCVYKPFCGICPIISFMQTGHFNSYQSFKNRCYIFKKMFNFVFDKMVSDPSFIKDFLPEQKAKYFELWAGLN